jgi:NAD-dependent dihydropyrimidine dehydrogenase PreA subunit
MTYIIAKACIDVRDGACVDVCPVDCIYSKPGDPQLYINPEECIDCAACEPVCPVNAIFPEDQTPADQKEFIKINYEYDYKSSSPGNNAGIGPKAAPKH